MTAAPTSPTPHAGRWARRPGWGVAVLIGVGYPAAWTALDLAAVRFEAAPDVSVWYPPTALDFTLLLPFGLRYTPLLLANTVVHATLVSTVGPTWPEALTFDLITTAGYAGAAAVLVRRIRIDLRLPSQRDVIWFVTFACGVGPGLVAAAQVAMLTIAGIVPRSQVAVSVAGY